MGLIRGDFHYNFTLLNLFDLQNPTGMKAGLGKPPGLGTALLSLLSAASRSQGHLCRVGGQEVM